MTARRPVLVAGPTASGKSALALRIAERDGGCVINADASQVYACWQILTARPGADDLSRAPHRLYGHVAGATRYSVGAWLREIGPILEVACQRGLRPVIVGGTGLYLSALTEGLADIPEIPADLRARSEAMLRSGHADTFLADLAREDPATLARIDRNNPMRLQRAWEVLKATGRGLSEWHRTTRPPILSEAETVRVVVLPGMPLLNKAISDRFHRMLEGGALDECRRFAQLGLDPSAPSARVLGAAPLLAHLAGTMSLDSAIATAVTASRQYAKRQRTWLRNRMADWTRIDPSAGDPLEFIPES